MSDSPLVSYFREADRYTRSDRPSQAHPIDLIVIHTMETPEQSHRAEWVIDYFAGNPDNRNASTHYGVDDDSIAQGVLEKHVAWAAPGANHNGIQIELTGRAGQSSDDWKDTFSGKMLKLTARLCAERMAVYEIPVEFVDQHGLKRGERGVTTHWEATKAFRRSTHTDPGPHFPMDDFLAMIEEKDDDMAEEKLDEVLRLLRGSREGDKANYGTGKDVLSLLIESVGGEFHDGQKQIRRELKDINQKLDELSREDS